MTRAVWTGTLSFGLVSIPVAVHKGTEEKTVRFNQLHDSDGGRIRQKKVCEKCGEEVNAASIVKGYELDKEVYVQITEDDLSAVAIESSRIVDVQQFVEWEEIDPSMLQSTYYLVPDKPGIKGYALLTRAMTETGRVGIAKVAMRDKERLVAVTVQDGALVMHTLLWPDEVRPIEYTEIDEARGTSTISKEEQMAVALVENLSEPFDVAAYSDTYREGMLEIIDRKSKGLEIVKPVETEPAAVVNIMDALKASLETTKKPARKTPARKTATRARRKTA